MDTILNYLINLDIVIKTEYRGATILDFSMNDGKVEFKQTPLLESLGMVVCPDCGNIQNVERECCTKCNKNIHYEKRDKRQGR